MLKVAMLGAGSAFTPKIVKDIILTEGIGPGEVRLVDIDERRLRICAAAIEKVVAHLKRDDWKVVASVDRRDILAGTDYIINCIEVSGLETVQFDNDIPSKYGIDQCIGDTIGPGGIMKALRTVPSWLGILRDIEELCPRALVLNYTNPMSIMTLAAARSTKLQVIGLCHSVQGGLIGLAKIAGVPHEEVAYEVAGINHLAWYTRFEHKGRDLYPVLFKRAKEEPEVYETDPVRFEMMFQFGRFVTESSGHFSEYVPYFRKRKDLMEKYCREGYKGGSRFYATEWPKWRADRDKWFEDIVKDITKMDFTRSVEYGADIVEAHYLNRKKVVYGSMPNEGLISNLPSDGVVEVKVLVDSTGFNPCRYGRLPTPLAALSASHMPVYASVVEGLLANDREAVIHGFMLDPLSAAVCSPAEIRAMAEELFAAEADFIPDFCRPKTAVSV